VEFENIGDVFLPILLWLNVPKNGIETNESALLRVNQQQNV